MVYTTGNWSLLKSSSQIKSACYVRFYRLFIRTLVIHFCMKALTLSITTK